MKQLNHSIGKKIRELRIKAGLTQEAFADRAEIHRSHMGEIERGEVDISLSALLKVAQGLGVTVSHLTQGIASQRSLRPLSATNQMLSAQVLIFSPKK